MPELHREPAPVLRRFHTSRAWVVWIVVASLLASCAGTEHTRPTTLSGDLEYLADFLREAHPAPFRYVEEPEWNELVRNEALRLEGLAVGEHSEAAWQLNFARSLHRVVGALGDFHVQVALPIYSAEDADVTLFPLPLVATQQGVAVDVDLADVPLGALITSVDNRTIDSVVRELMPLASADGRSPQAQRSAVIADFARFHAIAYGTQNSYDLELELPDGTDISVRLPAASPEELSLRMAERHSVAAMARASGLDEEEFSVELLADDVLLVQLPSFSTPDIDGYRQRLEDALSELQREPRRVVVDVRGNPGGYRTLPMPLLDDLLSEPYPFQRAQSTRIRRIPRRYTRSVTPLFPGSLDLLRRSRGTGPPWMQEGDETVTLMNPTGRFSSEVLVLTDGGTNSAANELTLSLVAHHPNARTVGQPPGGACDEHVGALPVLLALPASEVHVLISLVLVHHVHPERCVRGAGLEPDIPAVISVDDLQNGRDRALEAAIHAP